MREVKTIAMASCENALICGGRRVLEPLSGRLRTEVSVFKQAPHHVFSVTNHASRIVLLIFAFCFPLSVFAQDVPHISPAVKQAVDKAVAWLLEQQRAQGCFLDE